MPAQRAVTGAVVAVEADVLFEEKAEGGLRLPGPVRRSQHRAEHPREPAVLVAANARGAGIVVDLPRLGEIGKAGLGQPLVPAGGVKLEQAAHELIVVHPLTWPRDSRPG